MRPERSADLLQDIIDFIDRIETWVPASTDDASNNDEKTLYAVLHALQYIGEAVSRLPMEVTGLAPEVPWGRIRAMRNFIAHDYAGIDTDIVWKTVRERLPELRAAVM
ncbi:MAG: DUF86 domain-containing protein [Reyranella sp.]|nr:DUF86 domain-containing protein [Reyranella sp.]